MILNNVFKSSYRNLFENIYLSLNPSLEICLPGFSWFIIENIFDQWCYLNDFYLQWLENKVLGWLKLVYAGNRTNIGSDCIEGFKGRLLHFLWETYASVQIGQLFKIIIGRWDFILSFLHYQSSWWNQNNSKVWSGAMNLWLRCPSLIQKNGQGQVHAASYGNQYCLVLESWLEAFIMNLIHK